MNIPRKCNGCFTACLIPEASVPPKLIACISATDYALFYPTFRILIYYLFLQCTPEYLTVHLLKCLS